ncbi:hypothetical protein T492DRAFT_877672 [Pavlovales sp. CCMP2436]|nr:hypothetical protein T492DRAFT_877672 [Pavlovales sp. CCMP2436]
MLSAVTGRLLAPSGPRLRSCALSMVMGWLLAPSGPRPRCRALSVVTGWLLGARPRCRALSAVTGREARSLLGLPPAGREDARTIKVAYYQQALALHPDLNPSDAGAGERFARVTEACELLLFELERDGLPGADGHARTGSREAPHAGGAGADSEASKASQQSPQEPPLGARCPWPRPGAPVGKLRDER